jgi:hypothetical protein
MMPALFFTYSSRIIKRPEAFLQQIPFGARALHSNAVTISWIGSANLSCRLLGLDYLEKLCKTITTLS